MDKEYTWILWQGKFRLLTWNSFVGHLVNPVGVKRMG